MSDIPETMTTPRPGPPDDHQSSSSKKPLHLQELGKLAAVLESGQKLNQLPQMVMSFRNVLSQDKSMAIQFDSIKSLDSSVPGGMRLAETLPGKPMMPNGEPELSDFQKLMFGKKPKEQKRLIQQEIDWVRRRIVEISHDIGSGVFDVEAFETVKNRFAVIDEALHNLPNQQFAKNILGSHQYVDMVDKIRKITSQIAYQLLEVLGTNNRRDDDSENAVGQKSVQPDPRAPGGIPAEQGVKDRPAETPLEQHSKPELSDFPKSLVDKTSDEQEDLINKEIDQLHRKLVSLSVDIGSRLLDFDDLNAMATQVIVIETALANLSDYDQLFERIIDDSARNLDNFNMLRQLVHQKGLQNEQSVENSQSDFLKSLLDKTSDEQEELINKEIDRLHQTLVSVKEDPKPAELSVIEPILTQFKEIGKALIHLRVDNPQIAQKINSSDRYIRILYALSRRDPPSSVQTEASQEIEAVDKPQKSESLKSVNLLDPGVPEAIPAEQGVADLEPTAVALPRRPESSDNEPVISDFLKSLLGKTPDEREELINKEIDRLHQTLLSVTRDPKLVDLSVIEPILTHFKEIGKALIHLRVDNPQIAQKIYSSDHYTRFFYALCRPDPPSSVQTEASQELEAVNKPQKSDGLKPVKLLDPGVAGGIPAEQGAKGLDLPAESPPGKSKSSDSESESSEFQKSLVDKTPDEQERLIKQEVDQLHQKLVSLSIGSSIGTIYINEDVLDAIEAHLIDIDDAMIKLPEDHQSFAENMRSSERCIEIFEIFDRLVRQYKAQTAVDKPQESDSLKSGKLLDPGVPGGIPAEQGVTDLEPTALTLPREPESPDSKPGLSEFQKSLVDKTPDEQERLIKQEVDQLHQKLVSLSIGSSIGPIYSNKDVLDAIKTQVVDIDQALNNLPEDRQSFAKKVWSTDGSHEIIDILDRLVFQYKAQTAVDKFQESDSLKSLKSLDPGVPERIPAEQGVADLKPTAVALPTEPESSDSEPELSDFQKSLADKTPDEREELINKEIERVDLMLLGLSIDIISRPMKADDLRTILDQVNNVEEALHKLPQDNQMSIKIRHNNGLFHGVVDSLNRLLWQGEESQELMTVDKPQKSVLAEETILTASGETVGEQQSEQEGVPTEPGAVNLEPTTVTTSDSEPELSNFPKSLADKKLDEQVELIKRDIDRLHQKLVSLSVEHHIIPVNQDMLYSIKKRIIEIMNAVDNLPEPHKTSAKRAYFNRDFKELFDILERLKGEDDASLGSDSEDEKEDNKMPLAEKTILTTPGETVGEQQSEQEGVPTEPGAMNLEPPTFTPSDSKPELSNVPKSLVYKTPDEQVELINQEMDRLHLGLVSLSVEHQMNPVEKNMLYLIKKRIIEIMNAVDNLPEPHKTSTKSAYFNREFKELFNILERLKGEDDAPLGSDSEDEKEDNKMPLAEKTILTTPGETVGEQQSEQEGVPTEPGAVNLEPTTVTTSDSEPELSNFPKSLADKKLDEQVELIKQDIDWLHQKLVSLSVEHQMNPVEKNMLYLIKKRIIEIMNAVDNLPEPHKTFAKRAYFNREFKELFDILERQKGEASDSEDEGNDNKTPLADRTILTTPGETVEELQSEQSRVPTEPGAVNLEPTTVTPSDSEPELSDLPKSLIDKTPDEQVELIKQEIYRLHQKLVSLLVNHQIKQVGHDMLYLIENQLTEIVVAVRNLPEPHKNFVNTPHFAQLDKLFWECLKRQNEPTIAFASKNEGNDNKTPLAEKTILTTSVETVEEQQSEQSGVPTEPGAMNLEPPTVTPSDSEPELSDFPKSLIDKMPDEQAELIQNQVNRLHQMSLSLSVDTMTNHTGSDEFKTLETQFDEIKKALANLPEAHRPFAEKIERSDQYEHILKVIRYVNLFQYLSKLGNFDPQATEPITVVNQKLEQPGPGVPGEMPTMPRLEPPTETEVAQAPTSDSTLEPPTSETPTLQQIHKQLFDRIAEEKKKLSKSRIGCLSFDLMSRLVHAEKMDVPEDFTLRLLENKILETSTPITQAQLAKIKTILDNPPPRVVHSTLPDEILSLLARKTEMELDHWEDVVLDAIKAHYDVIVEHHQITLAYSDEALPEVPIERVDLIAHLVELKKILASVDLNEAYATQVEEMIKILDEHLPRLSPSVLEKSYPETVRQMLFDRIHEKKEEANEFQRHAYRWCGLVLRILVLAKKMKIPSRNGPPPAKNKIFLTSTPTTDDQLEQIEGHFEEFSSEVCSKELPAQMLDVVARRAEMDPEVWEDAVLDAIKAQFDVIREHICYTAQYGFDKEEEEQIPVEKIDLMAHLEELKGVIRRVQLNEAYQAQLQQFIEIVKTLPKWGAWFRKEYGNKPKLKPNDKNSRKIVLDLKSLDPGLSGGERGVEILKQPEEKSSKKPKSAANMMKPSAPLKPKPTEASELVETKPIEAAELAKPTNSSGPKEIKPTKVSETTGSKLANSAQQVMSKPKKTSESSGPKPKPTRPLEPRDSKPTKSSKPTEANKTKDSSKPPDAKPMKPSLKQDPTQSSMPIEAKPAKPMNQMKTNPTKPSNKRPNSSPTHTERCETIMAETMTPCSHPAQKGLKNSKIFWNSENFGLQDQLLDPVQRELYDLRAKVLLLEEEQTNVQQELKSMKTQNKNLKDKANKSGELQDELSKMRLEMEQQKVAFEELRKKNKKLEQEKEDGAAREQELKVQVKDLKEQIEIEQQTAIQAQQQAASLRRQQEGYDMKLAKAISVHDEQKKQELSAKDREMNKLHREIAKLQMTIESGTSTSYSFLNPLKPKPKQKSPKAELEELKWIKKGLEKSLELKEYKETIESLRTVTDLKSIQELCDFELGQLEQATKIYLDVLDMNIARIEKFNDTSDLFPLPKYPKLSEKFKTDYDKEMRRLQENEEIDRTCIFCSHGFKEGVVVIRCQQKLCRKVVHMECQKKWENTRTTKRNISKCIHCDGDIMTRK